MLDLILALGNKALMAKHWKMIFELVDKEESAQGNYSLKEFKDFGMQEHKDQIEEISAIATGEYTILDQIKKIETAWDITNLPI